MFEYNTTTTTEEPFLTKREYLTLEIMGIVREEAQVSSFWVRTCAEKADELIRECAKLDEKAAQEELQRKIEEECE